MPRFAIRNNATQGEKVRITGKDVKHIQKVLRLQINDEITLFDKYGNEYIATITANNKLYVEAEIIKKYCINRESPVKITLIQGLTKGDKMDFIVQKATELGVYSIIPSFMSRSEVIKTKKIERWQRIADESIKQCARNFSPRIYEEIIFEVAIEKFKSELNIIFSERNTQTKLIDIKNQNLSPNTITLVVGPEGGFTDDELFQASESGYVSVGLGSRVLRSETASITAIALIQHIYGDI